MADVSDFERLKDAISKLRAKTSASEKGRLLEGDNASARLAAILTEVDETILPRRLIFQWDKVHTVQLAVANRRLQGVLSPSAGPLEDLAGHPLSDPDDEKTTGIRDALLDVLEDAAGARILSQHLGDDDLGSDAGLAADALMRHWGLEAGADDQSADALPDFLAALKETATAWLLVEGEDVADQSGSEADIARLGETAAYLLDAYLNGKDALFGTGEEHCSFAVASADQGVFFADTGARTLFALTAPGDLATVATAWRVSFG